MTALTWIKAKFRAKFLSLRDFCFPERLLRGTPWEQEWRDLHRAGIVKFQRIYLPVSAVAWFSHTYLVDIPSNLQPAEMWLNFRLSMTAVALVASALAWWPRLARSRFYAMPFIGAGMIYCFMEAYAMRWTPLIHPLFPALFTIFHAWFLRVNPFWSFAYVIPIYAVSLPSYLANGTYSFTTVCSVLMIANMVTYFTSAKVIEEIRAFLGVRQLADAQKKMAEAKEKVLKKELELTGAVQALLMPTKEVTGDERFKLIGKNIPATQCGGDWWWYHQHGNKIRVLMGDVTGHGAGPAMVTASVSSYTKVLYDPLRPFVELLDGLAKNFFESFEKSNYWMTLTGCEIDLETGKASMWFAGAPPIFCVQDEDSIESFSETSAPLGSDPHPYGFVEHQIPKGGKLVILTDGMIEARRSGSESSIGLRRIQNLLLKMHAHESEQLLGEFFDFVHREQGDNPQDDDYTFVVIDYKGAVAKKSVA